MSRAIEIESILTALFQGGKKLAKKVLISTKKVGYVGWEKYIGRIKQRGKKKKKKHYPRETYKT